MNIKKRNLIEHYNNLSLPVKASMWFIVANIIQKGIAFLTTPIFTRIMTTEQYGTYTVYQSWYSIIYIFATLNLSAGVYNNGVTKYGEDRDRFTSSIQGLTTVITSIVFLIYLLNIEAWNKILNLPTILVLAMFLELFFIPAFNLWSAGQRYDYKYKKLITITLAMAFLSPLLGVIAVFLTPYKAEARIISFVLVQTSFSIIFYIYNLIKGKQLFVKKYWKFALQFNLPLIPHYLSMTVLNQSDRIMISQMVGQGKAAIYGVTYTLSMMMTIITSSINNSFIPYTYKSMKEGRYEGIRKNANFLIVLIGFACVGTMALGPEIIQIIAPIEYYEARWIVPPVSAALFFMFVYPLFCNIEFYFEKTKFIMIASCIGAFLNIILNLWLIPIMGYIAASYTTLICYILFAICHYIAHRIILKKEAKIHSDIYDIKFIIMASIVVLLVMVVMLSIYDYRIIRYIILTAILILVIVKKDLIISKLKNLRKPSK